MKKPCVSLSRGGKTVRNLAALACVLALCAALPRLPLALAEREVRSAARADGVEQLRMLWRGNLLCRPTGGDGVPLAGLDADGRRAVPTVLALGGGRLWGCHMGSYENRAYLSGVETWAVGEELSLIAPVSLASQQTGRAGFTVLLAAVNLPEEAVSGQLTLDFPGPDSPRLAQGAREGDVMFFLVPGEETWGQSRADMLEAAPFTLTLLDGEDRVLAERRGILGEALAEHRGILGEVLWA